MIHSPRTNGGLGARLAGGLLLLLAVLQVQADWAGFARYGAVAEVEIEERTARLNLRVRHSALPRLAELAAAEAPAAPPERIAARLLELRDAAGKPLPGQILSFRSGSPAAAAAPQNVPPDEPYYEAEIEYALPERTEALTLAPPAGVPSGEIGLIALHRGVPAADLMPLDRPQVLHLDWQNPWNSRFGDGALARRHAEPRSYLYIEPYEVRHEILIPLREILPRLDFRPRDPERIAATERAALAEALGAYLLSHNPVSIDGALVPPQLDRAEFLRYDRQGVRVLTENETLDSRAALAGAILVYLTEQPARKLELVWDSFDRAGDRRQVTAQYGVESFEATVTRRHPVFQWSADEALGLPEPIAASAGPEAAPLAAVPPPTAFFLRLAGAMIALAALSRVVQGRRFQPPGAVAELALLLALAGCVAFYPEIARVSEAAESPAPPLPEAAAKAELPPLLHNVYRAFQVRGEAAAYDRLALSLAGEALDEVYLRQRRALLQRDLGLGGEGRVDRIELLDSRVAHSGPDAVAIDARWVAHGTVSHWGHSHERRSEYRANLVLRPTPERRWKITELEFLDTRRREPVPAS